MEFEDMINRITLGDSYELIKDIPNNSIDCIYTDIPYLSIFSGGGSLKNKLGNYIKEEVEEFSNGIDYKILKDFVRVMKKINCFIWCSKSQILDIMNFFAKYEPDINILTWTKTNPIPFGASIWLSDIEYCLHFYKGASYNIGWEYKRKNFTSPINNKDKEKYKHPTIKPIQCVKNHLLNMTKDGDIILDPFSGSGTTCVAAKELNRRFIGIEKNLEYYKISLDRLNGILANGQISFSTDINKLKENN